MADTKESAFTLATEILAGDYIRLVKDPAGTPLSQNIKIGALRNGGWTPVNDTWTYASASTITIPAGGTSLYQKGVKIRLKQGGGFKYYVAYSVASTLITVFVSPDYTVANAAITDIAYSYELNPLNWPGWLAWVPTHSRGTTNYSNMPTVDLARFRVIGSLVFFTEQHTQHGTPGGSGTPRFTAPCTLAQRHVGYGLNVTTVAQQSSFGEASGSLISMFKYDGTADVTASQVYIFSGFYEY